MHTNSCSSDKVLNERRLPNEFQACSKLVNSEEKYEVNDNIVISDILVTK